MLFGWLEKDRLPLGEPFFMAHGHLFFGATVDGSLRVSRHGQFHVFASMELAVHVLEFRFGFRVDLHQVSAASSTSPTFFLVAVRKAVLGQVHFFLRVERPAALSSH